MSKVFTVTTVPEWVELTHEEFQAMQFTGEYGSLTPRDIVSRIARTRKESDQRRKARKASKASRKRNRK